MTFFEGLLKMIERRKPLATGLASKRIGLCLVLLVLSATHSGAAYGSGDESGDIVWRQDFESFPSGLVSKDWSGDNLGRVRASISSESSSAYYVASPTYTGNRALKFHVTGNNTGGSSTDWRSEITTSGYNRGEPNWEGTTHWIGWAFWLEADYPTNEDVRHRTVIFQTHHSVGDVGSSPTWGIRVLGDGSMVLTQEFATVSNRTHVLPIHANDLKGRWARAVVQVKYHGKDGFIRLWIDDQLKFELLGVTTWEPEAEVFGFYKVGLYPSWHRSSSAKGKTMYVDTLRIADERLGGDYKSVDPKGYLNLDDGDPLPPKDVLVR